MEAEECLECLFIFYLLAYQAITEVCKNFNQVVISSRNHLDCSFHWCSYYQHALFIFYSQYRWRLGGVENMDTIEVKSWKKKARNTETVICFNVFTAFKVSLLKIKNSFLKNWKGHWMFFPKHPIMLIFSSTCDVLFGDLEFLKLFHCSCNKTD